MTEPALYDRIGHHYNQHRKADPRLVSAIQKHLPQKDCKILEIGAGTGNYSLEFAKNGHTVFAVEPSKIMRDQAEFHPNLKWIPHTIENLPDELEPVDAVVSIMCIQHLKNIVSALQKCREYCPDGPIIIFTFDPRLSEPHWLYDYFPDLKALACEVFPSVNELGVYAESFLIPNDFQDQFAPTNWTHPERYLDPNYRKATSGFAFIEPERLNQQLLHLEMDLKAGKWKEKYGQALQRSEKDLGCRIVVFDT
jgi:SAM-dependent methyltransferase